MNGGLAARGVQGRWAPGAGRWRAEGLRRVGQLATELVGVGPQAAGFWFIGYIQLRGGSCNSNSLGAQQLRLRA